MEGRLEGRLKKGLGGSLGSLTREQLAAVLAQAAGNERDWLAILLAYNHGLRITEVIRLTPANFDLSTPVGFLSVQRLKGSLHTVQPLRDDERAAVQTFVALRSADEPLIGIKASMLGKLFVKYARLAGIPVHLRHFHVLKHSTAMHSIHQAGIHNVRQYLGHKSIASTGAYLRVTDSDASKAIQAALATTADGRVKS
jgi:type 1 fimbriae regulatory protein FimE